MYVPSDGVGYKLPVTPLFSFWEFGSGGGTRDGRHRQACTGRIRKYAKTRILSGVFVANNVTGRAAARVLPPVSIRLPSTELIHSVGWLGA